MTTTYKNFTATVVPCGERKMSFTISTASVDRDGDTIDPKGWDLSNYVKNPVVLWAHDYTQPPVGKAVNIKSTDSGLQADVEFLPQGVNPFADMIHDMCKGGFLNATSVGFRGKGEESKDRKGYDFKTQELLEFSIVPVPSNPEALALRGVNGDQVKRYAKDMREWSQGILGEQAAKMTQEQFDALSVEMAKILRNTPPEHKETPAPVGTNGIDIAALAKEVAKVLRETAEKEVTVVEKNEIDWDAIELTYPDVEIDPQYVSDLLLEGVRSTFREMASAQARAAINKMTGRLD